MAISDKQRKNTTELIRQHLPQPAGINSTPQYIVLNEPSWQTAGDTLLNTTKTFQHLPLGYVAI